MKIVSRNQLAGGMWTVPHLWTAKSAAHRCLNSHETADRGVVPWLFTLPTCPAATGPPI